MREAGERITIRIGGVIYCKRAVVTNTGKNFMRKYPDDDSVKKLLGSARSRDKLAFIPYFKAFDDADSDIIITWRRERYKVIADSVMMMGDEPFYIWAILTKITATEGDYYENIHGTDA